MKKPSIQKVAEVMRRKGMKVFTSPFDMTMFAIRTNDNKSETFNDWIGMLYHDEKNVLCGFVLPGTVDAGTYYRVDPMNDKGTAIIQHDVQHMGVYEYQNPKEDGLPGHKGQEAFRQVKPMKYWRDNDRNIFIGMEEGNPQFETYPEEISNSATNGHDMGTAGVRVHTWSAACWGSTNANMDKMYSAAKLQIKHGHGKRFSFAVLYEKTF